jgi:hypothetical protein
MFVVDINQRFLHDLVDVLAGLICMHADAQHAVVFGEYGFCGVGRGAICFASSSAEVRWHMRIKQLPILLPKLSRCLAAPADTHQLTVNSRTCCASPVDTSPYNQRICAGCSSFICATGGHCLHSSGCTPATLRSYLSMRSQ